MWSRLRKLCFTSVLGVVIATAYACTDVAAPRSTDEEAFGYSGVATSAIWGVSRAGVEYVGALRSKVTVEHSASGMRHSTGPATIVSLTCC
jgi:hypothetical protein